MARDTDAEGEPTRREYVKYGGALVSGGLLAGCTDGGASESPAGTDRGSTSTRTETGHPTATETAARSETAATEDESYSVTMEPVGTVEFDGPPSEWTAMLPTYADMAVAVGGGQPTGIQMPSRFPTRWYDQLPGVDYDHDADLAKLQNADKELFYELDADLHLMDPNLLVQWYDWSEGDVDEIAGNVGPFLGNFIRRRRDEWHDYRFYTLYEAFEKVAQVFRGEERYAAFERLHDEFVERVQSRLPPGDERPRVLLVYPKSDDAEALYPYQIYGGGVGKKQWRDLKVTDAARDTEAYDVSISESGYIDHEGLLKLNPDVLLFRGQEPKSRSAFEETVADSLRSSRVAAEVDAVQNGRLYPAGIIDQGPIMNLFQTEMAAKQLYPEEFGEWPGFGSGGAGGAYPDVPTDERLFDRERVADIATGRHSES